MKKIYPDVCIFWWDPYLLKDIHLFSQIIVSPTEK